MPLVLSQKPMRTFLSVFEQRSAHFSFVVSLGFTCHQFTHGGRSIFARSMLFIQVPCFALFENYFTFQRISSSRLDLILLAAKGNTVKATPGKIHPDVIIFPGKLLPFCCLSRDCLHVPAYFAFCVTPTFSLSLLPSQTISPFSFYSLFLIATFSLTLSPSLSRFSHSLYIFSIQLFPYI